MAKQTQQPTPPPTVAPAVTAPVAQVPGVSGPATAAEMYEAMRHQKEVLADQLQDLQNTRMEIAQRLRSSEVMGADRAGLEARLQQVDARITQLDAQIAVADQQVALAAAQPGAIVSEPPNYEGDRIELVGILGTIFLFVCVLPLSIAYARRLWKKHAVTIALPPELTGRLDTIERGVEAVSIELERVGEGQRFVTQLLAGRERPPTPALPRDPGSQPM